MCLLENLREQQWVWNYIRVACHFYQQGSMGSKLEAFVLWQSLCQNWILSICFDFFEQDRSIRASLGYNIKTLKVFTNFQTTGQYCMSDSMVI